MFAYIHTSTMKNSKLGKKKYKAYNLERKGALGSLMLQLSHMLKESVTIKRLMSLKSGLMYTRIMRKVPARQYSAQISLQLMKESPSSFLFLENN